MSWWDFVAAVFTFVVILMAIMILVGYPNVLFSPPGGEWDGTFTEVPSLILSLLF